MTELWRGFADMAATAGREVVIARGRGSTVWDDKGKAYLDSTASLWYMNVGYGREEIADAVGAQLKQLAAFHTFGPFANPPLLELADKVAGLSAMPGAAVFFTSGGGSDAVDTAAKLARRYWNAVGRPEKQIIISREHGYHGTNGFGTSLQGIPANRTGYGDLVPHVENIPWGDADALERLLHDHGDRVAALIGEPVIGAGGVIPPPDGFWRRVQELCRLHDVLLISDEVICGFGRLGSDFGCQRFGVTPDMMTCAKGLTSGYVPMGAVVVSDRVKQPFFSGDSGEMFRHGYTYGGHPGAAAAGLANLAIIEREGLVERVRELEPVLAEAYQERFVGHPMVAEVRSIGLAAAVEFTPEALAATPRLTDVVSDLALEHGLIGRGLRGVAMQVSPPFVVTEDEIAEMARRLRLAVDDAMRLAPAA
jgi:adenosylmethionine-8-amino-7-oxononanoate aminotransferase